VAYLVPFVADLMIELADLPTKTCFGIRDRAVVGG